jgi:hypothetical protein
VLFCSVAGSLLTAYCGTYWHGEAVLG